MDRVAAAERTAAAQRAAGNARRSGRPGAMSIRPVARALAGGWSRGRAGVVPGTRTRVPEPVLAST